jgi:5'-deoxynucleotidase YfbR-like HD superfamily hydrolase
VNWNRLKLMRTAARVRRCHTMTTIHSQSVGEHTFGLMALLIELCEPSDNHKGILNPRLSKLLVAALYHDAPEAITGDMPAPVKSGYPQLKDAMASAEKGIAIEFDLYVELTVFEKSILRYCDLMECALYAMEEIETGNIAMAKVFRNCMNGIRKDRLADVTPSALRLYDMLQTKYELKYVSNLGEDVTHGWPEFD